MLFNSVGFLIFFALFWVMYRLLGHRGQNILLLTGSYVFYAAWDWRFLSLLIFSTLADFFIARWISRTEAPRMRKALVVLSLSVSVGMLCYFKYFNFFVENMQQLLAALGFHETRSWHLDVVLPIGISFYTFQTINYTIDVYRREIPATGNLLNFAAFVSFFPHLVAGPIMRASRLLPQVDAPRTVTFDKISEGTYLILYGLFQKVVVADNLARIADAVFSPGAARDSWLGVLTGVYAFAFQIYGDFAGYSNMALGVAKWLGFELPVNFRQPYFATNPAEFWRRWHISLSSWLRDYLYIPLGGDRQGRLKTLRNLMATMLLGGLWHGAAWTFVLWGAFHGFLLVAHRLVAGGTDRTGRPVVAAPLWRPVKMFAFFHLVCLGWLLFRAPTLAQAMQMLGTLGSGFGSAAAPEMSALFLRMAVLVVPMLLFEIPQYRADSAAVALRWALPLRVAVCVTLFYSVILFGVNDAQSFIYFQF